MNQFKSAFENPRHPRSIFNNVKKINRVTKFKKVFYNDVKLKNRTD